MVLILFKNLRLVFLWVALITLTGCIEDLKNLFNRKPEATPSISKLDVSNNIVTIKGNNLSTVSSLKLKDNAGQSYQLVISQQTSTQIIAGVSSALNLTMGSVYNLIISSASAADISVPISIQLPNGSVSPSALSSGGATSGQVLKWNGNAWAPGTDNVGAGGGGSGGSGSGGFWFAQLDGTLVAQILVWSGSLSFVIWDDINKVAIAYQNPSTGTYKVQGKGSFYLMYKTTDCSDDPHSGPVGSTSAGSLPGTAWALGNVLYKVDTATDSGTRVAMRGEDNNGNLTACTIMQTPQQGSFFKVTQITPSIPLSIPVGSIKVINMGTPVNNNPSSGSGDSSSLWIAQMNGTPIAKVVGSPENGNGRLQLWDESNQVMVYYTTNTPGDTTNTMRAGGVTFFYNTTNCSDTPHMSAGFNAISGQGVFFGSNFYKVDSTVDTFAPVALRSSDTFGVLGNCQVQAMSSAKYFRTTQATPALPQFFALGDYKYIMH